MKNPVSFSVSQQEVERRLREYREESSDKRAMPHIIYRPPFIVCPWPNCDYSIAGIDFPLELMGDQVLYQQLMDQWWKGNGLVGLCPGCAKYVLFTMHDKSAVENPGELSSVTLPDHWYEHAYLLS